MKFLQELNEAKHMGLSDPSQLFRELRDIIWDVFEDTYPENYSNQEDFLDAVISDVMKRVEKAVPLEHKERITSMLWSTYHSFDESEFYDTESLVDALINELVNDLRFMVNLLLKK